MSLSSYAMHPLITLSGGMVTPREQPSQTLSFANTFFEYQPNHSSVIQPLVGGLVGTEYSLNHLLAWQFGLAFYQMASISINGEETQAPTLSLAAINTWNYHYNLLCRQLLFENKLLFTLQEQYRPYLLVGIGVGFNHSYGFQVTAQNAGEVATATFDNQKNKSFIYIVGFGVDVEVFKKIRLGAGYRIGYLGKYDLGNGVINTGAGGGIFYLPPLQSPYSLNQEVLIQLTYLF